MRRVALGLAALVAGAFVPALDRLHAGGSVCVPGRGLASWYGETHRGKTMANGQKFDPGACTAASWFYPLGTKVRVALDQPDQAARSLEVAITDRGPAQKWVEQGRIIDLSQAAFEALAPTNRGLIRVSVEPISTADTDPQ